MQDSRGRGACRPLHSPVVHAGTSSTSTNDRACRAGRASRLRVTSRFLHHRENSCRARARQWCPPPTFWPTLYTLPLGRLLFAVRKLASHIGSVYRTFYEKRLLLKVQGSCPRFCKSTIRKSGTPAVARYGAIPVVPLWISTEVLQELLDFLNICFFEVWWCK